MLEKLITSIKNSLPGSNGKNSDDEENDDLDDVDLDSNDDEKPSGEDDAKKKRVSMIIRVVVILGIAYFALDEFVLKEPTPTGPTPEEIMAKKPKKKKPNDKTEVTAAGTEKVAPKEGDPVAASTSPETTNEVPPIENVNILDKEAPIAETPTKTTDVVESKPIETANVDQKIDQLIDKVDQDAGTPVPAGSSTEEIKVPSQPSSSQEPKASMASKIVEEAVETAPPKYDQLGRGLVYNCTDKYWACVDKPAYIICNKNMKWNKSKGSTAECAVSAIYNSDEDCAKIQKYNVSTNQPTTFCQN